MTEVEILKVTGSITLAVLEPDSCYLLTLDGLSPHRPLECWSLLEALVVPGRSYAVVKTEENPQGYYGDLWVKSEDGPWLSVSRLLFEYDYADECEPHGPWDS